MQRIEVNVQSGERRIIDLTPVEVADAEARTLVENDPRQSIKAQLAAIDVATGSVRWVRELALGVNVAWEKQREIQPDLPLPGTGMAKVQAIEDQCKALRAQLAALP